MSSRREFLRLSATAGAALLTPLRSPSYTTEPVNFPPQQERMLDDLQHRAVRYFFEQADPETGLVRDRARMTGPEARRIASIAATGFGLSALCVGEARGFLPTEVARKRVERTLEHLIQHSPHKNGFYPHFLDLESGNRAWKSEFSSVDTAWLVCGALHAGEHFSSRHITSMAHEIYARVDWQWMLNGGQTLSHGWTPEHGFLPYRWDTYSELLAMYLLAIGSPTYAVPAASWDAWKRPVHTEGKLSFIETAAPLFAHQYSHAWFDFRGRRDRYADYFQNSRLATEAHRLRCLELADKYPWFNQGMWGVTASDSRKGYLAWGASHRPGAIDGTLVPCASAGSLPFLPTECVTVLENMLEHYGNKCFGRYGFVDAFHPNAAWYDPDVVGIDQGITVLMSENARTGQIWETLAANPHVARSFALVGL